MKLVIVLLIIIAGSGLSYCGCLHQPTKETDEQHQEDLKHKTEMARMSLILSLSGQIDQAVKDSDWKHAESLLDEQGYIAGKLSGDANFFIEETRKYQFRKRAQIKKRRVQNVR